MAALTTAVADALRDGHVDGLTATLIAQVGVGIFMTAFEQRTAAEDPPDLAELMDDALRRVRDTICRQT